MTPRPAIDPALDPDKLAGAFARHGRLHLPGFLRPADAQAIGQALKGPVPWSRATQVSGNPYDIPLPTLEAMPPERRAELDAAVREAAKSGFNYLYDSWRISDGLEAGRRAGGALAPLEAVWDFLNSEPFLGFVRRLTGDKRCAYADAQATRYGPGDFLTRHDDDVAGKNRLYAYVLNFTPVWRADWGGVLLFLDADGHVAEGYAPAFNALNIFRVPQAHAVSQVTTFADADRLSITGWVRAKAP